MSNLLFTAVSVKQQEIVAGGRGRITFKNSAVNNGVAIGQNTGSGGNQINLFKIVNIININLVFLFFMGNGSSINISQLLKNR